MTKTRNKYRVIAETTLFELYRGVERYLDQGWELVGGIFHDKIYYYQAVTKKEDI